MTNNNEQDEFCNEQMYNAAEREMDIYRNEISKLKEELRAFKAKQEARGAHTKEKLHSMLEDVVTVLDLSDSVIEKHGPMGTEPSELVKLVMEEKDRIIYALQNGVQVIHPNHKPTAPSSLVEELEELLCPALYVPEAKDKWWVNKIREILSRHESEARVEVVLVEALEKLSRLGNGDMPGNSNGNVIAQEALAKYRAIFVEDKGEK